MGEGLPHSVSDVVIGNSTHRRAECECQLMTEINYVSGDRGPSLRMAFATLMILFNVASTSWMAFASSAESSDGRLSILSCSR